MDFTSFEEFQDGIIIRDIRNFDVKQIFECGQCFRWKKKKNGNYITVAYDRVIEVEQNDKDVILHNTNKEDFINIWCQYFDLHRDYSSIKNTLSMDDILRKSVEFGDGIRLLRQDPFEITVSFITSANNRIPMIKRAINNISAQFGKQIHYNGETYYTFPTPDVLKTATIEDLEACGVGFRAKYIKDTVEKICIGKEFDLDYIRSLDDNECHEVLQKFNGIGPKVSDCIMLFSMQKYSAFPVDVWVKRAMGYFYLAPDVSLKKIRDFGRNKFGELSGFAQQYLFYYARENNIVI